MVAAAADFRPARRGGGRGGGGGDDGDNDNGERLLTKIEVVVMTGIARDEALRGDALVDALASSDQKDRAREDESKGGRRRAKEWEESRGEFGGGGERGPGTRGRESESA